jgi:hypothetical protein
MYWIRDHPMQPLVHLREWHVAPDVRHVSETARVLRISEFEIFRLAYRFWYQRELGAVVLNEAFVDYLHHQKVPSWVRDFCRRVLNLAAVGQLRPRDFGVDNSEVNRIATIGRLYTALITAFAFFIYLFFLA